MFEDEHHHRTILNKKSFGRIFAYLQVFFKITVHSVTSDRSDTYKLGIDWSSVKYFAIIFFKILIIDTPSKQWFSYMPICHTVILGFTQFNHLELTSSAVLPLTSWHGSYRGMLPVAYNFLYTHYVFACSLRFINLFSFFHRL